MKQKLELDDAVNAPMAQLTQLAIPAYPCEVPAAHATQPLAPTVEYAPAAQLRHSHEPTAPLVDR